jgi:DNA-nicking Smr family endonuclease
MSRDGGKPGKTGRHVTRDEAALWSSTTLSVRRVKVKARVATHAAEPAPPATDPAPPRPAGPEPARAERRSSASAKIAPVRAAPAPRPAVPAAEFERRASRKVATGKVRIDATLDLHGLQRSDAHARLRAFLRNSQAQGHRMLLIITGKGGEVETGDHLARSLGRPGRGILRRSVPEWLEEPELRPVVLSYATAGLRHGGSGALYVRLRKAREA